VDGGLGDLIAHISHPIYDVHRVSEGHRRHSGAREEPKGPKKETKLNDT